MNKDKIEDGGGGGHSAYEINNSGPFKTPSLVSTSTQLGSAPPKVPNPPTATIASLKSGLQFPLDVYKTNILRTIYGNRLSLITGPFGIGKSSKIPQYLLDEATNKKRRIRVICAVSHRLRAASIARVVANDRQEKLGVTVGFHDILETRVSPVHNPLTYTTYEALLRAFVTASNFALDSTTHVIVEIEELNPYAELLLFHLVNALSELPSLSIVVMASGTTDNIKLMQHLTSIRQTAINTLAISMNMQMGEIEHIPALKFPHDPSFQALIRKTTEIEKCIVRGHETPTYLNLELLCQYLYHLHRTTEKSYTILIFVPDYSSLARLMRMILFDAYYQLPDETFVVHFLHSKTETKEYEKILVSELDGRRKIILATSIAENCVDIKADIVIDTGKIRRDFVVDGVRKNVISWISKRAANHRARLAVRKCYRMYTQNAYNNMTSTHRLPEIPRHTINKLAVYGSCLLKDKSDVFTRFMQPINHNVMEEARTLMNKQGILYTTGKITKLGIMTLSFSVDPCYMRALIRGVTLRCLDPVVTLIAALWLREDHFITNNDWNSIQRPRKIENAEAGISALSDHFSIIAAYKEWEEVLLKANYIPIEYDFDKVAIFDVLHKLRWVILRQLKACGFIQPDGHADMDELNRYSNSWPIVKAALLTAIFPHVITAHSTEDKLIGTFCDCTSSIELHPGSVFTLPTYFRNHRECWIMFDELVPDIARNSFEIRGCSLITLLSICASADDVYLADILTNDLLFEKVNKFSGINVSPDNLLGFKNEVQSLITKQLNEPGREYDKEETHFLAQLVEYITKEDDKFGILVRQN